jgi:hypothetical protein
MSSSDSYSESGSDSEDNQGESIALTHSTLVHKSASISSFKTQKSSSMSSLSKYKSQSSSPPIDQSPATAVSKEAPVSQPQQRHSIKFVVTNVNEKNDDNNMDEQDFTEKNLSN